MKAVIFKTHGGPEVLEFTDVPDLKSIQTSFDWRLR
jgi:hypothetical protein